MRFEKTKLFLKMDSDSRHVHCVAYDDDADYYTFLRKCRSDGYRQVVITSEMMMQIIRHACLENNYTISKIEFVEEDSDLETEIALILQAMSGNSAYLTDLLNKLRFLSEKSSIDLKRIYVKGLTENNITVNYFVQSNGIIGVNREAFSKISNEISILVEECLQ